MDTSEADWYYDTQSWWMDHPYNPGPDYIPLEITVEKLKKFWAEFQSALSISADPMRDVMEKLKLVASHSGGSQSVDRSLLPKPVPKSLGPRSEKHFDRRGNKRF